MALSDRFKGPNPYIPQLSVSYRPIEGSNLQVDFGKFYTSVGAEVADPSANPNYSRSLLFTLGEPLYHFGLRVNVPVTKTFTAGVQVTNGWNDVEDNNSGKSVGVTTALTESKWAWSQAFLIGPEKAATTAGQRQLANEVLTLTPCTSMQAYIELLYGHDQRVEGGADAWYGAAASYRWSVTKKMSVSPRYEYYIDQTGFTSGTPQHLRDMTFTAEYRWIPALATRLEYRRDSSDQDVFPERSGNLRKNQNTLLVALLLSYKERNSVSRQLNHFESNHQGKDNMLLFPAPGSPPPRPNRAVSCHPRLGGLLNFYQHAA